jgi:hypothetical protein
MTERWAVVPGFPRYEVSDLGRVRNIASGLVLVNCREKRGYLTVSLYPGKKTHMVHLLVARAFLGPCPEGQECRHDDGDPGNPALSNLLYGTRAENRMDAYRHGTCNAEKDLSIGRKTRDTKDARYGRSNWTNLQRTGVAYSKAYDL